MKHSRFFRLVAVLAGLALPFLAVATDAKKPETDATGRPRPQYDDELLQQMDHGPFYSGVFNGRDIALKSVAVKLSADNKTVFLEYAGPVAPVMQQRVKFNLNDANGKPLKTAGLYHTINTVPAH